MTTLETIEVGGMISYLIDVRLPSPLPARSVSINWVCKCQEDRHAFPPREDLPLPTQPPYTAFVGNLAFDLTEHDLESFFDGLKVRFVSTAGNDPAHLP